MRAEIHVPISPTPSFFMQVQLLAASLRRFGGALADSPVIVTVSRDCEPFDIAAAQPWSERLGVSWRWMEADAFERFGIYGTALMRLTYDFEAPFVLMLDADTIVAGPLDDLLELEDAEALGGVIAHVAPTLFKTPFADSVGRGGQMFWLDLFESAGLPAPDSIYEHLGWGMLDTDPGRRFCPPYFNLGMLAAPAPIARRIGEVVLDDMQRVNEFADTNFRCQLAVALSLVRTDTTALALAVQWNFPNHQPLADTTPEDSADVRILHYRKRDQISRNEELASLDGIDRLLRRTDLLPVNALLQERVAAIRENLEPVPAHA